MVFNPQSQFDPLSGPFCRSASLPSQLLPTPTPAHPRLRRDQGLRMELVALSTVECPCGREEAGFLPGFSGGHAGGPCPSELISTPLEGLPGSLQRRQSSHLRPQGHAPPMHTTHCMQQEAPGPWVRARRRWASPCSTPEVLRPGRNRSAQSRFRGCPGCPLPPAFRKLCGGEAALLTSTALCPRAAAEAEGTCAMAPVRSGHQDSSQKAGAPRGAQMRPAPLVGCRPNCPGQLLHVGDSLPFVVPGLPT